jgi:dTDP-4-amino-4,6-dideoxygalactose transaminase
MARVSRRIPLTRPVFGVEEEKLLLETLRSGWVTQGPRVEEFEARFAEAVGAQHAVAVSSGTTALFLSLHALGIGPGDEVVVPSLTFIASANAVLHAGATPVLVDVEPRSFNLDPAALEAAVTPRTRALLPVHQLGQPADLDAIGAVAARHGLALVEDAACAVGARHRGRPVGSSAHVACFSFHPRKVLVTGEGGMITTPDAALAARLRRLRHQGMGVSDLERHRAASAVVESYPEIGYNFRLSDLQAAVGIAQVARLEALVEARRACAARYDRAFAGWPELELRACPEWARPNHQSYILSLRGAGRAERNRLLDALLARGVASRRGLMAVHREAPYRDARRAGDLAESERADAQSFLLPIFPGLAADDQDYVVEQLAAALRELRP